MSVSVDSLNLQGHYFVLRKACYNTNPKHLEDYAHPWIEGETEEQEHQSLLCLWDMVAGVGWDLKVFPKHVLKSEEGLRLNKKRSGPSPPCFLIFTC